VSIPSPPHSGFICTELRSSWFVSDVEREAVLRVAVRLQVARPEPNPSSGDPRRGFYVACRCFGAATVWDIDTTPVATRWRELESASSVLMGIGADRGMASTNE